MTIPCHVTVAGDLVLPVLSALMSPTHDFTPPPPAAGLWTLGMEIPVTAMWAPGLLLQQNKMTMTVVHKGQFIMQEGHDCGSMIPHLTYPPVNLDLPLIIMFSSRQVMFSASTVKANGAAVGCSQLAIPFPMMTCSDPVSVPTSAPLNFVNNVKVGMTPNDIWAGVIAIGVSVVADLISARGGIKKLRRLKRMKGKVKKIPAQNIMKAASRALTKKNAKRLMKKAGKKAAGGGLGDQLVKNGAGLVTGGAKIMLTGEGSLALKTGSAYAGVGASYSHSSAGEHKLAGSGQLLTASASESGSYNTTDGTITTESSTTYSHDGQRTKTTKKNRTTGEETQTETKFTKNDDQTHVEQRKTEKKPGKEPKTTESEFQGSDETNLPNWDGL